MPVLRHEHGTENRPGRDSRRLQGMRGRVARPASDELITGQEHRRTGSTDARNPSAVRSLRAVRRPYRPHLGRAVPVLRSCYPRADQGGSAPGHGPRRRSDPERARPHGPVLRGNEDAGAPARLKARNSEGPQLRKKAGRAGARLRCVRGPSRHEGWAEVASPGDRPSSWPHRWAEYR